MEKIELDYIFSRELFTKVFWKLREAKTRFVINYGGANSSKSWSQAQNEIIRLMSGEQDILILRKIAADLYDSVYMQIRTIIDQWDLMDEFRFAFSGSRREIQYLYTGGRFIFRGLDDPNKLKSIVNIKRIWGEETNEFDIEDHKEINRRARGQKNIQISYTFNPIIESHWLKGHFFDTPEIAKKALKIHSTIEDNPFATKDDWDTLEEYKLYDINQYNIYRYGQWGKPGVKRPFAFAFKDRHITHGLQFDFNEIVYLSFDFNVDPITCLGCQHTKDKLRIIKEFRLSNSDIYDLCREIRETFIRTVYFRITGDASGSARTAITKGPVNYYTIIKTELRLSNRQFFVPSANPGVKNTRALVNALLMKTDFLIDDTCRFLIDDLRYVEVNEHGEVDKVKAEKEGMNHLLDCLRYYCFIYHNKFLKQIPKKLLNY